MERILKTYYANNAEKLHKMVDGIVLKFGGLSDKDMDDFYSLANEVFVDVMKRFDHTQSFDAFLYSCLSNKMKTEITKRNCEKRKADRMCISIDAPVGDDENLTLGDMIADCYEMETEFLQQSEEGYSNKVLLYLSRLSGLQKDVLGLIIAGYPPDEIIDELHITKKQYADCDAAIHSYRNMSILL